MTATPNQKENQFKSFATTPFNNNIKYDENNMLIANYILIANSEKDDLYGLRIKYLNLRINEWENIPLNETNDASKKCQLMKEIIFPKVDKRLIAIEKFNTNYIHLFVTNYQQTIDSSTFNMSLNVNDCGTQRIIQIIIDVNQQQYQLMDVNEIEFDDGYNSEIIDIQFLDHTLHVFSNQIATKKIIHSIFNNSTNKLERIETVPNVHYHHIRSIIPNPNDKSMTIQQTNGEYFTFFKFNVKTNKWKRNDQMKHKHNLSDKDTTPFIKYGEYTSIIYLNDNTKAFFDGSETNIWYQTLNQNNDYIQSPINLPTRGVFQAWISDEQKKNDALVNRYSIELCQKEKIQMIPFYLIKIIFKYFHDKQVVLILIKSTNQNHFDMLQTWKINVSNLFA